MASFSSNVAANTTAKGSQDTGSIFPAGPREAGQFVHTELSYDIKAYNYYVTFTGNFILQQGIPVGGTVDQIVTGAGLSPVGLRIPDQTFTAEPGEVYGITALIDAFDDPEAYFSFLFRHDDTIHGSPFDDRLAGYNGDDQVYGGDGRDKLYGNKGKDGLDGGADNDKLWGGKSRDKFYFGEGYDKDKAMDVEKNKDKFVIDTALASRFGQVKKAAHETGNKLVLDFGDGDKLVIKKFELKDLHKSMVEFDDFSI
ncbi:MAG: hypothetical protein KDJ86_04550 [Bauldia sp.]|uniref:calcium-binding protein n=1 Tax=Bauldia sp. TaxID=2575872 RepID=UPI001D27899F|nr:calcium-binding protein [Bauldia sp.]MCB1495033.1 hypothetical protein [Bauldia sp.]